MGPVRGELPSSLRGELPSSVRGELVEPRTEEPPQVVIARIRAAAQDGIDDADATWLEALARDAGDGPDGRLVLANALSALAGSQGSPARAALRRLLVGGDGAPPAGDLARELAVELLALESDDDARNLLRAAEHDPSALVRAKAARALALAEGGRP